LSNGHFFCYADIDGTLVQIGDLHFETRERIRYSRDQLLELREITDVPEQILRVKQEIEAELHGDDQSWVRSDSNVQLQTQTETQTQGQAQNRFTETDNRDWRARTEKPPAPAVQEEKSWDNIRETKELYNSGRKQEQFNKQDQMSSQFASKAQVKGPSVAYSFAPFDLCDICLWLKF
jgi:translation initiation factor 4G